MRLQKDIHEVYEERIPKVIPVDAQRICFVAGWQRVSRLAGRQFVRGW
jgi:hypothetical protein